MIEDRLVHFLMLVEKGVLVVEKVIYPLVRREDQVKIHPCKVYEYEIMRRLGKQKMEVKVCLRALFGAGKSLFRRRYDAQYPCEIRGSSAHRAFTGDRGIKYAASLHKLKYGGILKLDRAAVRGDGAGVTHKAPFTGDRLDKPKKLHHTEGLAQRTAAHAESIHKLTLRRKRIARKNIARGYFTLQFFNHFFIDSSSS